MAYPIRLAVVLSHPIQYHAPWFRRIAARDEMVLKVFYLWEGGLGQAFDRGFQQAVTWDIPLLDRYDSEFVPNVAQDPGTHHFGGLDNPRLEKRIAEWTPDAILSFGYSYRSLARLLRSKRLKGVPLLIRGDSHDIARDVGIVPTLRRWIRRSLFRRASGALSVGQANRRYFLASGIASDRVFHVPAAVENERFAAAGPDAGAAWRREQGIAEGALVFLFAGKFEPKKCPLDVVAAHRRLRAGLDAAGAADPVVVLVGAGALEAEIRGAAGEEVGRSVYFVPFQNQSRMPAVYAASDVLVLPSRGNGETWGLVVNEAMAAGLPAIVSDHVGCAEDLVTPGETGWVVPVGDREALAGAMREAMDPETRARLGRGARRRIESYSYEVATDHLVEALRIVLDESGSND